MPRPQGTRADTLDDMTDSDTKDQDRKTTLSLGNRGKLGLAKGGDANQVRQSFSHGRSKTVQVEVKRKRVLRSEEHTSELQSLMRISYAVFCLKKKKKTKRT